MDFPRYVIFQNNIKLDLTKFQAITFEDIKKTSSGTNNVEEMAKERIDRNVWAIKLLQKAHVSYKKRDNKIWNHIEFEVGDLMWLNMWKF